MSERDWRIAAVLFVVISSAYFATVAGVTSSNDGSHYALVRALVDKRSFEIAEYLDFAENQDYAINGDRRFSDRPPGTAILSAPVYALSAFLPKPLAMIHSKHDTDNPRVMYAMIVPVAAASATAIILFWMLRGHFGLSEWASVLTTLAFAFGTMAWKYGSLLYSHATSGVYVMLAIALILRFQTDAVPKTASVYSFWIGLILGASVLMEYTNTVFVAVAGVWWVLIPPPVPLSRRDTPSGEGGLMARLPSFIWLIIGGLLPALFLMGYNATNFGSPFSLSTFNADTTRWPQNESFLADFATPIWVGLPAMLFYGSDNQGLFWLAPVSLLGLFGLKGLWQRSRREFTLIVGGFAAMLLLFSTSTTFNPYTNDGRYITPFLGLWFVAVGFGVARIVGAGPAPAQAGQPQGWPVREMVVFGLFFLSIRNQIMHIAFAWGHDLNLAVLSPWAAPPENIVALWNAVLPNVFNLPLWWGIMAAGWVVWREMRRAAEPESLKH